jgi:hypothetical protein
MKALMHYENPVTLSNADAHFRLPLAQIHAPVLGGMALTAVVQACERRHRDNVALKTCSKFDSGQETEVNYQCFKAL